MKKLLLIPVLVSIMNLFSCQSDDNSSTDSNCKVIARYTDGFIYDEYFGDIVYPVNSSGKIQFKYEGDNINQVNGGITSSSDPLSFNSIYSFNDSYKEDVTFSNNYVYTKNQTLYLNIFEIIDKKIISKNIGNRSIKSYCVYQYDNDKIYEKDMETNKLIRTFYMKNGNLERVERIGEFAGRTYKIEYIFSDYDSKDNLLKGKFYVDGAFYIAFSKNNYRTYSIKRTEITDGNIISTSSEDYTIGKEKFANLYETDCSK